MVIMGKRNGSFRNSLRLHVKKNAAGIDQPENSGRHLRTSGTIDANEGGCLTRMIPQQSRKALAVIECVSCSIIKVDVNRLSSG